MTFKPTLAINADFAKIQYPVYAQAMLDLIEPVVPVAVAALKRHELV